MENGKVSRRSASAPVGPPAGSAVAAKRRDEIVTAATDIIAEQGLHRLSLARIEKRAGMTRGQLTYYFPTKEDILLGVFDRMLHRMIERAVAEAAERGVPAPGTGKAWECLKHGLAQTLDPARTDRGDQLRALIHTFMAQIPHRDDFAAKLAAANRGWRDHLAADIAAAGPGPVRPPVLASVLMALLTGLSGQLAVDPNAFDRAEMADACLRMLAPLFHQTHPAPGEDR